MQPALNTTLSTTLDWSDEFEGDLSRWRQDDLIVSASGRTGNKYIQPDGTIDLTKPWHKLPGRWAAMYDEYREECQFIENGQLVQKGYAVATSNPYRESFVDYYGVTHDYGNYMLYGSFLSSVDTITRGSIIEVCVDATDMCMRGHRWSAWIMPTDGKAYTDSVFYAEIDCPELEHPSRVPNSTFGKRALLKIVGGAAGDTPNGNVDLSAHGINLREGKHTFTTVWHHNGTLEFYCDGILLNRDDREVGMVGRVYLTRELCSGVKNLPSSRLATFNKLTGESVETINELNEYAATQAEMIDKARLLIDAVELLTVDGFEQFSDEAGLIDGDRITEEESRQAYIARLKSEIAAHEGNVKASKDVTYAWENYTTGPKMPADPGLTAQSVILDVDLIEKDEVRIDYVRVFKIVDQKTDPEPDVDLGDPVSIDDLTIDEQIALLASQYERAESRIVEQNDYIAELTAALAASNAVAEQKTQELAEYREKTNATIGRLKDTELSLLAEIDELKKKPMPAPPKPVAPPVSQKSLDRLRKLLQRACR